jgi:ABC-type uncharacterized transport system auxiliary subunit
LNTHPKTRESKALLGSAVAVALISVLSGCTATAWTEKVKIDSTPMPTECAGWQKIDLKQRTTMVLLRQDPKLVVDIDSHNLRGRNLGCWQ